jgi:hypothetical protein
MTAAALVAGPCVRGVLSAFLAIFATNGRDSGDHEQYGEQREEQHGEHASANPDLSQLRLIQMRRDHLRTNGGGTCESLCVLAAPPDRAAREEQ